jgi:hypothetical protein
MATGLLNLVTNAMEGGLAGALVARAIYLYYIKKNLKRVYETVGVLAFYIIVIVIVNTIAVRLPTPPSPPISEYWGLQHTLSIYYWVIAIIDEVLHIIIPLLPNELDPLQAIMRSLLSIIVLSARLTAVYTVLYWLYPTAPLFILAGLYGAVVRPRSSTNGLMIGIGLSIILSTPVLGYFVVGVVTALHAVLAYPPPPCYSVGLVLVFTTGPEPLVINSTQGWSMANKTQILIWQGWVAPFITWACEPFKITGVIWDWLGLNYTTTSPSYILNIGVMSLTAQSPGHIITCGNASCGAYRIIEEHQLGINASLATLPNNTIIIRNESITLWAWAGGYWSNCSISVEPSRMYPVENLTQLYVYLSVIPWPLSTYEEPPAVAPTNYTQVIINATAYNKTCALALRPGSPPWGGYLNVPITGPVMWSLGWVGELVQAVNDLYLAFESGVTAFAVSIVIGVLLGIGLGGEVSAAVGLTGFTIVRIAESIWDIIRTVILAG